MLPLCRCLFVSISAAPFIPLSFNYSHGSREVLLHKAKAGTSLLVYIKDLSFKATGSAARQWEYERERERETLRTDIERDWQRKNEVGTLKDWWDISPNEGCNLQKTDQIVTNQLSINILKSKRVKKTFKLNHFHLAEQLQSTLKAKSMWTFLLTFVCVCLTLKEWSKWMKTM